MAVANRALGRSEAKAPPSLRLGPVLLVAGAAIVVIALLQVVQSSEATTASFNIQRLEEQKLELETSVQQLGAEVAALSSLSRIEDEAKRLGLGPAQAQDAVVVNVPGPAHDLGRLPSRFAPGETKQAGGDGQGTSWWRSLLKHLPIY